MFSPF